ncbi:PRC-barrel domain-containing protein [Atopobiaceae bacterium 24-176]
MLTMEQLVGQKVFVPRPEGKRTKADGTPATPKRIGKVHNLVFSPEGTRVVGLMVKRPDVAGMVKREDLFVALDAVGTFEGGMIVEGDDGSGPEAATKRGLDLDRCIIWGGMDVATRSGKQLGYVTDVQFDYGTGAVDTVFVTDGAVAASVVGSVPVPGSMLLGYSKGFMVVCDEAASLELTGGLAAKAGEGFAHAKIAGKQAASKAGEAVDKGSFALGRALGSAKRSISEAMADDGSDDPLPDARAEAVRVEAAAAPKAVEGEAGEPPLYAPAGTAGVTGDVGSKKPEGVSSKKEDPDKVAQAAKAVGRQLGKTQGMFKSFLKEFEEASK